MRFLRANGGVLEFSDNSQAMLCSHRQLRSTDTEAGGVLLGRLILSSDDVIVDRATPPSPQDRRSRFAFFRARRPAQFAVDEAWSTSGNVMNYLGEWHTHPEDYPTPSRIDTRDWKRVVSRAQFEQHALFFAIVGRVSTRVWELSKSDPVPKLLTSDEQDLSRRYT